MDAATPIAVGRTAEVYAWEENQVLKLFQPWMSPGAVEHEARLTRIIQASGLPVAKVGALVEIRGRQGLIYERVDGSSMLEDFSSSPWRARRHARMLADLHAQVHTTACGEGVPCQAETMTDKIRRAALLPEKLRTDALRLLESLPRGDRLCHGDFHPGNVLLSTRGPVIIDWIDATCGHPLADVARSSILMGMSHIPETGFYGCVLKLLRSSFLRTYLSHYFRLRPNDRALLDDWRAVKAAARLAEGVEEEPQLLAYVERQLPRLISRHR